MGTGLAFISGSALVRESGGAPLAQGVFGGVSLAPGGLALAVVPQLEEALRLASAVLDGPRPVARSCSQPCWCSRRAPPQPQRPPGRRTGVVRDRRLHRLAILYAASYGLGVVLANWVVELLQRHSEMSDGAAAAVGALTLLLVVVSRPSGGLDPAGHPRRARAVVAASLVAGTRRNARAAAADPAWLAVPVRCSSGSAPGIPFSPAFTGAAATRPDAPAAAVGFVNTAANLVVLVGTPLLGLAFSLSGNGRLGFAASGAPVAASLALLPSRSALGVRTAVSP